MWFKDNHTTAHLENNTGFADRQQYTIQKPDPNGKFSFRIPLKHIFGFCDDYEKVVYSFKHQLTLVTKGDNDAIFKTGAVAAVGDVPAIAEPDDGKGCFDKTLLEYATCDFKFARKTCTLQKN